MRLGPLLVTSGRSIWVTLLGILASVLLRSKPVVAKAVALLTASWVGTLYLLLTVLTWPQRAPRPPPPAPERAAEPVEASA